MQESSDIAGIAALADPLRRRLYRYVARSGGAVRREEVAEALGVSVHAARFHLDRLVDDGLLEAEFRRLTGRTGPGAGRPAKLYRRAQRDFTVSVPERHYDLLSEVLAAAAAASVAERVPIDVVAPGVARGRGRRLGEQRATAVDGVPPLEALATTLDEVGYEPRLDGAGMTLENCPFDRVARDHTELVCGLNLDFVDGVIDGLGCAGVSASLEPSAGRCCVTAREDDGAR